MANFYQGLTPTSLNLVGEWANLLFQDKCHLDGNHVGRIIGVRLDELGFGTHGKKCSVLNTKQPSETSGMRCIRRLRKDIISTSMCRNQRTSNRWAWVSFPSTFFFITPSWYKPMVARTSNVALSAGSIPSKTNTTEIAFQASVAPVSAPPLHTKRRWICEGWKKKAARNGVPFSQLTKFTPLCLAHISQVHHYPMEGTSYQDLIFIVIGLFQRGITFSVNSLKIGDISIVVTGWQ